MKKEEVPQDISRTYGGHRKVIYALNDGGDYETVESSGWETEEFVTLMAVEELRQLAADAYQRAQKGISSPLEYHMYSKRLDVAGLAQASGFFQWQIRRHLKPRVFAGLSQARLNRYCEVLGVAISDLKTLPDRFPVNDS
jgi:hypothetical protein